MTFAKRKRAQELRRREQARVPVLVPSWLPGTSAPIGIGYSQTRELSRKVLGCRDGQQGVFSEITAGVRECVTHAISTLNRIRAKSSPRCTPDGPPRRAIAAIRSSTQYHVSTSTVTPQPVGDPHQTKGPSRPIPDGVRFRHFRPRELECCSSIDNTFAPFSLACARSQC